jgi:hypothetical protein
MLSQFFEPESAPPAAPLRPPSSQLDRDALERLGVHDVASAVPADHQPLTVLAPKHLQRPRGRVNQPCVAYPAKRVERHFSDSIEPRGRGRQDFADPVGGDFDMSGSRKCRQPVASPSGHVRYDDIGTEVQLGLHQDPPAPRSTVAVLKGRSHRCRDACGYDRVGRTWPWRRDELAANDLADDVFRERGEVFVACGTSRGLRHASKLARPIRKGDAEPQSRAGAGPDRASGSHDGQ